MNEMMARLVDVPLTRMFVLAGIIFLLVAVLGRIEGKIEPGKLGRIGASVVGSLLIIVGLAMHVLEGDVVRSWLRESAAPKPAERARTANADVRGPAVRPTAAPERVSPKYSEVLQSGDAAAKAGEDRYTIKVLAGTYGRNCGAKPGNATAHLAKACDGRAICDYRIEASVLLEDPAPKCNKDYAAEWRCGAGPAVYSASVSGDAGRGGGVLLVCSGR